MAWCSGGPSRPSLLLPSKFLERCACFFLLIPPPSRDSLLLSKWFAHCSILLPDGVCIYVRVQDEWDTGDHPTWLQPLQWALAGLIPLAFVLGLSLTSIIQYRVGRSLNRLRGDFERPAETDMPSSFVDPRSLPPSPSLPTHNITAPSGPSSAPLGCNSEAETRRLADTPPCCCVCRPSSPPPPFFPAALSAVTDTARHLQGKSRGTEMSAPYAPSSPSPAFKQANAFLLSFLWQRSRPLSFLPFMRFPPPPPSMLPALLLTVCGEQGEHSSSANRDQARGV